MTRISKTMVAMTAKEMALTPHSLSRDGMAAATRDGTFKWSNHFGVWAGPFPRASGDPKAPKR